MSPEWDPAGALDPTGPRAARPRKRWVAPLFGFTFCGLPGAGLLVLFVMLASWGPASCSFDLYRCDSDEGLLAAQGDADGLGKSLRDRKGAARQERADQALSCALSNGQLATAQVALDMGADPDGRTYDEPPIERAATTNDVRFLQLIEDAGATFEPDPNQSRPLDLALRAAVRVEAPVEPAVLDWLLSRGADPVGIEPTAVAAATYGGQHAALDRFLDGGIDPNDVTVDLLNTWLYGRAVASPAIASVASSPRTATTSGETDPNPRTTLVAIALAQRDLEALGLLLTRGADPDALSLGAYVPLYLAALDCNPAAVQMLLDGGATARPLLEPSLQPLQPDTCPEVRALLE